MKSFYVSLGQLVGIFFGAAFLIFLVILAASGGKTVHDEILEEVKKPAVESLGVGSGFDEVKFYTNNYNGHDYVICLGWFGRGSQMCMIHSPDCSCMRKEQ